MFWVLQFLISIAIIIFIPNTILRTLILLVLWHITFNYKNKLTKRDYQFFGLFSLIFTLSNYGALKNLVFQFTHQDILLMPYNEIFMWGFYCLNSYKLIGKIDVRNKLKIPVIALTVLFAISFSAIKSEILLTLVGLVILMLALILLHNERKTYYFIFYFAFMGLVVEIYGVHLNFWVYPNTSYFNWPLWGPLMWMNIGWIMSQMSSFFYENSN